MYMEKGDLTAKYSQVQWFLFCSQFDLSQQQLVRDERLRAQPHTGVSTDCDGNSYMQLNS